MADVNVVAESIVRAVGGEENIRSVEHCATRLRLILKDSAKYRKDDIELIEGIKGQFFAAGQHQIVLGTGFVDKVYKAVADSGVATGGVQIDPYAGLNTFQRISRTLGDVFVPIIPTLVATGLFMGLRGLVANLGLTLDANLLALSQVLTDTAFAFLPVLVMYSVMRRFGGSPALGIVIGLMLVAPQLPSANAIANGAAAPLIFDILGLSIPVLGYQGSVLPALVIGLAAVRVEKSLKNIVPDVLDLILTPFLTLLITLFCGLFILGPIMHEVEFLLVAGVRYLLAIPFGIGGFVIGALQQVVVITGLHHTFKTLEVELLAQLGANPFNTLASGAIIAQVGACIATALKTPSKVKKSLYITSAIPGMLGITEPLIFGVNLPRLKPFIYGCVGGGCAGAFSSIMGLAGTGMSITVIPGTLLYLNGQIPQYIISSLIGFGVAFGLTMLLYNPEE